MTLHKNMENRREKINTGIHFKRTKTVILERKNEINEGEPITKNTIKFSTDKSIQHWIKRALSYSLSLHQFSHT